MAQEGTPYLIPFGAAGMVAHPNRWRAKAGELLLAENVVVENDQLNKEPAATYYEKAGGLDVLNLKLTWSGTNLQVAIVAWYDALPTAAVLGDVLTAGIATVPTPWVTSFTAGAPVGALVAVRISASGNAAANAVVDSRGNTYTKVADEGYINQVRGQLWVSILTTALQAGDTLTITPFGTPKMNVLATAIRDVVTPLKLRDIIHDAKDTTQWGTSPFLLWGRTSAYPVLGIALIASSATPTPDFSQSAPFTHNASTAAAGMTLVGMATDVYWNDTKIVAQVEWNADDTSTLTNTVQVTAGATTVTGTGTTFTTAFRPGDGIIVGGEMQIINTITSNTVLQTIAPWQSSQNVTSVIRRAGPVLVTAYNLSTDGKGHLSRELPDSGARGNHGTLGNVGLAGNLARVRPGRFVVGGKEIAANPRKLFYLNGVDPIQVVSGDAVPAHVIAKPAADWGTAQDATKQPINAIVHQDSLVAFGNLNDPHRVYFSTPADHEDFQTTAAPNVPFISIRIASNVGQRLYGAAQFQGVLFLWKYPRGIFYIDDTLPDRLSQWSYRIKSMALGCAPSPYAVLATDDDVIFCDGEGHFHLLSAVANLGGTRDSDITRSLGLHTWTQQNIDVGQLRSLVSTYDGATKTAWFGLRSTSAPANNPGDNDLVIRWDFSLIPEGGPPRMTTARLWRPNALCTKHHDYDGRQAVVIGEQGNSWFVEPGTYGRRTDYDYVANVDAPRGVPTKVDLPALDFGDTVPTNRARRKAYRSLEVIAQATEAKDHPLTVDLDVDAIRRQSLPYPQGINRRRLNTLNVGDGYDVAAHLSTDGSVVGDVPLIGLIVYYDALGTDMSRRS